MQLATMTTMLVILMIDNEVKIDTHQKRRIYKYKYKYKYNYKYKYKYKYKYRGRLSAATTNALCTVLCSVTGAFTVEGNGI